jgi:hypothetical protein
MAITRETVVLKNEKGREITVSKGRVAAFTAAGWTEDAKATKAAEKDAKS